MYKTYIIALSLILLGINDLRAQSFKENDRPTREQISQSKRDFLIKTLNLSTEEANKIMPILGELDEKRFQLWQETRSMDRRVLDQDPTLTDAELSEYAERKLNNRVKEAELERTYYLRCRPYLSTKQFVYLEHSCHRFAREFFHRRTKQINKKEK